MITVHINGAARQLAEDCDLSCLVEDLGYAGKRIAIECNGEIVPRSLYAGHMLHEGDRLEIVGAVGGG